MEIAVSDFLYSGEKEGLGRGEMRQTSLRMLRESEWIARESLKLIINAAVEEGERVNTEKEVAEKEKSFEEKKEKANKEISSEETDKLETEKKLFEHEVIMEEVIGN